MSIAQKSGATPIRLMVRGKLNAKELAVLGWKSANEEISLDELRAGIAYNSIYIGDLTNDEMESLEEGFMAHRMNKKIEEMA